MTAECEQEEPYSRKLRARLHPEPAAGVSRH